MNNGAFLKLIEAEKLKRDKNIQKCKLYRRRRRPFLLQKRRKLADELEPIYAVQYDWFPPGSATGDIDQAAESAGEFMAYAPTYPKPEDKDDLVGPNWRDQLVENTYENAKEAQREYLNQMMFEETAEGKAPAYKLKTNAVDGIYYGNIEDDIKKGKVHEIKLKSQKLQRICIKNQADGKYHEVIIGNVPKRHSKLLELLKSTTEKAFDPSNKFLPVRNDHKDLGKMLALGSRKMQEGVQRLSQSDESVFVPGRNPGLRAHVIACINEYYDFLKTWVGHGILEAITEVGKPVAEAVLQDFEQKEREDERRFQREDERHEMMIPAIIDMIRALKGKHIYNFIVSKNLYNSLHKDKRDTSVCCTIWVHKNPDDPILAYLVLPNVRINGKPVAIRIRHGTFITWNGKELWHCTSIQHRNDSNNIYGCFVSAPKTFGKFMTKRSAEQL